MSDKIASLFPKALQDKSNLAMEKVINKAFDIALKPMMFLFFDTCDARILPLLAAAFHVQGIEGWDFAKTEQEKRNLLKEALLIHRYKGTKAALKRVLNVLNITGEIHEWFEYRGRPMYFKVLLEVFDKPLSIETETQLIELIYEFKNVRSKLEVLEIYLIETAKMYTYCQLVSGQTISVDVIERGDENV